MGKIKIPGKDIPPPISQDIKDEDCDKSPSSNSEEEEGKDKKMNEKEKHKVRQRQRRQKMTNTMDRLKSMVPECVKREAAVATGNKKMKVDQTQLLEMTVDYIQQLTDTISKLEQENNILRSYVNTNCINNNNNHHHQMNTSPTFSDSSADISSSSPDNSPNELEFQNTYYNQQNIYQNNIFQEYNFDQQQYHHISPNNNNNNTNQNLNHSNSSNNFNVFSDSLLTKRNLSTLYQGKVVEPRRVAKQPTYVRAARVLMVLFVFGILFYSPISYPIQNYYPLSSTTSSNQFMGRVLQSTSYFDVQSSFISTCLNWISYFIIFLFTKLIMLMSWTFCAMLLDYIYVPSDNLVKLAKKENDIGVKKFDRGDYHGSKRHFEKAMSFLGRSPSPSVFYRTYHLPLEMWRQVLHLLRIGLWCDGHLVHLRGGQNYMLEMARCNHYLFSLNMLANNLDSHSILNLVVSLNAAESLYQKPPLLAEVYATIAMAFYGLLKMPKAYQYLMGKAWHIVDNFKNEEMHEEESSVDNTKAYLLFLSSYGNLCDGKLLKVQSQIQRACDLFLKKGNKHMFFQGQFYSSYIHFLRGNYFTTMQIMKSLDVCNLGDPRISWWREVLLICCKVSLLHFS